MPFDTANPLVELADQYAAPEHCRMVVGHSFAQRNQAGGKIVELTVVSSNSFAEPRHVGRELVEVAVVPGDGLRNLLSS